MMCCWRFIGIVLIQLAIIDPGSAAAGGVRDLQDAWLIQPPAMVALLEDSLGHAHRWQVCLGLGRLYGLDELEQACLELERRWSSGMVAATWQRLGSDLYSESIWRASLLLGSFWRLGGRLGVSSLEAGGEPLGQEAEVDLLLQIPLPGELLLYAWWPLTPAPPWYGQHGLRRWLLLQGGGEFWAWAAVADRSPSGQPSLQGEILLKVAPRAALGLRCEPATGTVGICTAWRVQGMVLRTSHTLHPDLGPSHRWGLVLGGGQ